MKNSKQNKRKYSFYPLFELYTNLHQNLEIDEGVSIVPNNIDLDKIETITISTIDKIHFKEAYYCLRVNEEIIDPKVASLIFMLSCRIFKCSTVFIRYRLNSSNQINDLFDQYPHIPSEGVTSEITTNEFLEISKLYKKIYSFKDLNTRSHNICYFLGLAYRSISWLESLMFFVCALETITSSDKFENGLTKKFSKRINNFIGYDLTKIEKIYNVRSELVHGRHNSKSIEQNLELVIIAEEITRKVIIKLFSIEDHFSIFIDDKKRLELFERFLK